MSLNHDMFDPLRLPPRPLPTRRSPSPWQPFAIVGFLLGLFVGLAAVAMWLANK